MKQKKNLTIIRTWRFVVMSQQSTTCLYTEPD